jgi:hypothetical protein
VIVGKEMVMLLLVVLRHVLVRVGDRSLRPVLEGRGLQLVVVVVMFLLLVLQLQLMGLARTRVLVMVMVVALLEVMAMVGY